MGQVEIPVTSQDIQEKEFTSSYIPFTVKSLYWDVNKNQYYEQETLGSPQELSADYTEAEMFSKVPESEKDSNLPRNCF